MAKTIFKKAVILGVGLMGGSLALALKKKKVATSVWGWGRNKARLNAAKKGLKLNGVSTDLAQACAGADLVILAGPFRHYENQLKKLSALGVEPELVTDLGSIKGNHVAGWEKAAGTLPFVAGHPMCGSEKTGWKSAVARLYEGSACILTPTRKTRPADLALAVRLWKALGSRVLRMSPSAHDRKIGALSHLTHLSAFSLARAIDGLVSKGDYKLAGTGYRDSTRIAGADPDMWVEILMGNRNEVLNGGAALRRDLAAVEGLLRKRDRAGLKRWLVAASKIRRSRLS